jgi:GTPase
MGIEKAFLVGVAAGRTKTSTAREHMEELQRLVETSGAEVVDSALQRLPAINPSTLIGTGKLVEIGEQCAEQCIDLLVFDEDLTGSQVRNIEKLIPNIKILDRSGVILDIFANHARTAESRIMVEIAQLEYLYPRLTRAWTHLSRQVGGIGTRGPGETQLEVDRRLVQKRVGELKRKLVKIENSRNLQAVRRNSSFHVGVVGYTNAGKSTLTNRLTSANVLVEDKLFATLDSTTRRLYLNPTLSVLLSDTVGFIRKLPHHLVASFKTTLSVVSQADLVLHLIDGSAIDYLEHMEVTHHVLRGLCDEATPRLLVFNKSDLLSESLLNLLQSRHPEAVFISAGSGVGIESLRNRIAQEHELWKKQHYDYSTN